MPANIHDFTDHLLIRDPESEPTNKNLENGGNGENDLLCNAHTLSNANAQRNATVGWDAPRPDFPTRTPSLARMHAAPRAHINQSRLLPSSRSAVRALESSVP
jgi:hypothetical protein